MTHSLLNPTRRAFLTGTAAIGGSAMRHSPCIGGGELEKHAGTTLEVNLVKARAAKR